MRRLPRVDALHVALLVVIAVSTGGLVLAERSSSQRGIWIAKPLASAAFVALGVPVADPWLFVALVLSFLGDLCLVPKDARVFRAGILLFLLAHVAFVGAFLARGPSWPLVAIALAPLSLAAIAVARWILPKAARELKGAVVAYVIVITVMVAVAAGSGLMLAVPALMFWTNDILVARDRFVAQSWLNRLAGLPLYYGAMALFALHASGWL